MLMIFAMTLLTISQTTAALVEEELDYDSIVSELKASSRTSIPSEVDPFDSIAIYGALGLTSTLLNVAPELGSSKSGLLTGFEAGFGIDLFTPAWQAEGTVRSFNEDRLSSTMKVSLKEFDLKFMHTSPISNRLKLRIGGGLAARYMRLDSPETLKSRYTTPASIIDVELKAQVTKILAIRTDISIRNSLISETVDRSAIQGALKMDFQF